MIRWQSQLNQVPLEAWTFVLANSTPYALFLSLRPDGRVILETSTARPTDQRWLEIHPAAQNWLAEIFRLAHEAAIGHRADLAP